MKKGENEDENQKVSEKVEEKQDIKKENIETVQTSEIDKNKGNDGESTPNRKSIVKSPVIKITTKKEAPPEINKKEFSTPKTVLPDITKGKKRFSQVDTQEKKDNLEDGSTDKNEEKKESNDDKDKENESKPVKKTIMKRNFAPKNTGRNSSTANRMSITSKNNIKPRSLKSRITQDVEEDENDYPFDSGLKCAIF